MRWKLMRRDAALQGEQKRLSNSLTTMKIELCSHIGGHAFAGNVIICIPRDFRPIKNQDVSCLAGKSIWYGRVEPRHVEGIVTETLENGRVIQELLRGVHGFDRGA